VLLNLLSMDGLEIAAISMCHTDECPVCECPKDKLERTDFLYPLQSSSMWRNHQVSGGVNPDGSIKNRSKGRVCNDMVYMSVMISCQKLMSCGIHQS
jgi:hypothetical protein